VIKCIKWKIIKMIKVIKWKSEKTAHHEKWSKKGGYVTLGGKCHFMRFPSHLVGAFLPNRMDPRLLHFRPKNGVLTFLMNFDTFFMIFIFWFCHFLTFLILWFCHFLLFFDFCHFLTFLILMIFVDFCWFFMFEMNFDQFLCQI